MDATAPEKRKARQHGALGFADAMVLPLFLSAIFTLAASFSAASAHAQLIKIHVGYSAISGDALPAWVAKDAGIFEKNGLDVQLVFFTGGTTAVMALVSADTPIAQLAGPAVINSVMAGSDATLIA